MNYLKALFVTVLVTLFAGAAFSQTPAAVERELAGYLANVSKYGNYGDSYDEDKLRTNNDDLRAKLIKHGKRADILKFAFAGLKDKMYVTTSKDGRFRIYSWDLESGGTMHNFDRVFQYKGKSGKIYTWAGTDSDHEDGDAFYHQIFQTDTPTGSIYLGVSTNIASTSNAGQRISAFRINGEKLDINVKVIKTSSGISNSVGFQFDFFSVVERKERPIRLFTYDESKKSFRFPIVIQNKKTPQGRVTNRYITYRFDGKYFVRV